MTEGKAKTLNITDNTGKSHERLIADMAVGGVMTSASLTTSFSSGLLGEIDLGACIAALNQKSKAVHAGDLSEAETLLMSQAMALDAMFAAMARRAYNNMGEYIGAAETYMRLALKAQSQCRATLETLATMKNPPMVIARQANISNGPQQVNNGVQGNNATITRGRAQARAGNSENMPNKLLEEGHEERMDTGAAQTAGGTDPELETVGALNRPPHG